MSNHVFRNPDKFERRPERDYLRDRNPDGCDGFIVEDLDLVMRVYGPKFYTDADGRFRLVEIKHGNAPLGVSKKRTFGLIDRALRAGAPDRYDGFYVIRTDSPEWETVERFTVNAVDLEPDEFDAWCQFRLNVEPYKFR